MEEKVKIFHAKDKNEAERLLAFLKVNGIEAVHQQLGEGLYRDLYGGYRWFGEEILVNKEEEQKALTVVQAFINTPAAKERKRSFLDKFRKR